MPEFNPIDLLMQDQGRRDTRIAAQRERTSGLQNIEIKSLLNELSNAQTMREIARKHANTKDLSAQEHQQGMGLQELKGGQALSEIGATGTQTRLDTLLDKYGVMGKAGDLSSPSLDISNILQRRRDLQNLKLFNEAMQAQAGSRVGHQITAPTSMDEIPKLPLIPKTPSSVSAAAAGNEAMAKIGNKREVGSIDFDKASGKLVDVKETTTGERTTKDKNVPGVDEQQAPVIDEASNRTGTAPTSHTKDNAMNLIDNEISYLTEKGYTNILPTGQPGEYTAVNPEGQRKKVTIR